MATDIRIHLLDRGLGHAVQVWDFSDREEISIGRAKDADIRLADPQVSRVHAHLVYRSGAWRLESLGRAGVFVGGQSVSGVSLTDGTVFHLGANGPALEFLGEPIDDAHEEATQSVDLNTLSNLFIDTAARDQEVKQVTESDFFQQIRRHASRFRSESGKAEDA